MISFLRQAEEFPCRLRQLLKKHGYSRTHIRKLKQQAAFYLDGCPVAFSSLILPGQIIQMDFTPYSALLAQDLPVPVVFEDEYLLVADKPAGMLSHTTTRQSAGTLVNFLAGRTSSGFDGAHLVSRLDRAASGLVLVAKTARLHHLLANTLLKKTYRALLNGRLPARAGAIDLPIARKPGSIIQRQISPAGKPSLTFYRVLTDYPDGSALVEFDLITGRTHQLRVHAAALGCPLRGDGLYGPDDGGRGFFLRAHELAFRHPISGMPVIVTAPDVEGL